MPYIDPQPATLEVRLYRPDPADGHRVLPLAGDGLPGVMGGTNGRVTASEGYRDATLVLSGRASDWPDVEVGRRVEFYARYRSRLLPGTERLDLLWDGDIQRVVPQRQASGGAGGGPLYSLRVELYGVWSEAGKARCVKAYANADRAGRSAIFRDLATRYPCRAGGRLSGVAVQAVPIPDDGDEIDALDAYADGAGVPFSRAAAQLAQDTGRVATGGETLPPASPGALRQRRLFFRPYDDLTQPARHTIPLPAEQVARIARELDATRQVTELTVVGGRTRYPNLLAQAVEGNTSFEAHDKPGDSQAGNLIENGSFESVAGGGGPESAEGWTLTGGASVKTNGDGSGEAYDGERFLRLDGVGEKATQTAQEGENLPPTALVAGETLVVSVRAYLGQDARPARGRARLVWKAAGGADLSTAGDVPLGRVGAELSTARDLFSGAFVVPAGAEGLRVELENTYQASPGDASYALLIDDVRVYVQGRVTARGWQPRVEGTAQFDVLRWDDDSGPDGKGGWHGGRCVLARVSGCEPDSAGNNEAHVEPFGRNRFSVLGGQSVVCGCVVALEPGSPPIDVQLNVSEWDGDGNAIEAPGGGPRGKQDFTVSSSGWQVISFAHDLDDDALQALFQVDFQSDGGVYIDAAFVFSASAPAVAAARPERFVPGERFVATFKAADLFAPAGPYPDAALYAAALALGGLPDEEQREEVTSEGDGLLYARDVFLARLGAQARVTFETSGVLETGDSGQSTATMMPGESVRLVGAAGSGAEDVLPEPLCLSERSWQWDGGRLTITAMPGTEPRDPARTIAALVRKAVREGSAGGRDVTSGRLSGGGSSETGGGGLTAEQVRDLVAAFVQPGTGISITHDDPADTLTVAATGGPGSGGWGDVTAGETWYAPPDGADLPSASGDDWEVVETLSGVLVASGAAGTPESGWLAAYDPLIDRLIVTVPTDAPLGLSYTVRAYDATLTQSAHVGFDLNARVDSSAAGGASGQVQFNDGGSLGGAAGVRYFPPTGRLAVGGSSFLPQAALHFNQPSGFFPVFVSNQGGNASTDAAEIALEANYNGTTVDPVSADYFAIASRPGLGLGVYSGASGGDVLRVEGDRIVFGAVGFGSGTAADGSANVVIDAATGNITLGGEIRTSQALSATGPVGSVVRKLPLYDEAGSLLGYVPVYATIS